jgi:hypothetical protein
MKKKVAKKKVLKRPRAKGAGIVVLKKKKGIKAELREWRWWENEEGQESAKLGKLIEAFAFGCTDDEACYYADITPDQLYYFQEKNSKFASRKRLLKQRPILLARKAVVEGVASGDKDFSLKFLERVKKDEFALTQNRQTGLIENNGTINIQNNTIHATAESIRELDPANQKRLLEVLDAICGVDE